MARAIPNAPEIEGSLDGRVRRGARNREQILDALYALIQSGEIQPTAEQVARKAGVGARTVFRHFEDMERLNAEMSMRVERSVRPLFEAPPVRGSLEERVRALVKGRVQLWEKIAPFRRSGMAWEGRSEVLRKNRLRMNRLMRGSLVEALGPEIEGSPDGRVRRGARNREQILDALYALIQSGEIQPTAEQVARKAGVGARTVFRHFEDMERLNAEMSGRVERSVRPLFEGPPIRGSLEERVRALLRLRGQFWEKFAPFRRSCVAL